MLRLHILASGSGGNAAIVENAATGEGVLIDCGICKRDFFARAEDAVASVGAAFEPFGGGDVLEAAGLAVRPFRTSHDAADSYGFRFDELTGASEGCDSLGYMTDTGIVTDKAWEALSGVRLLALESNHDARMLEVGPYPYVIKQRIASARGHLSNDQAREALDNLAHENLRAVAAMHVSQENNTYRLPRETFEAVIAEHGLSTTVSVAFQNRLVTIG